MERETRQFPRATTPCLRVQVGRMETRSLTTPVYEPGGRMLGHEAQADRVSVFHLLGYGETLAAATARADGLDLSLDYPL